MIHYEFVNLQVCHWQTQLQMIHVIVKYFFFCYYSRTNYLRYEVSSSWPSV